MRTILHCDLNNFYASVECLRHPEIAHLPVAVTGDPEKRHGIVLAKNQIAKRFGIKTGDTVREARQKCPSLVCVAPHYEDYVRLSDRVFGIYTRYTDRVEAFGPDECWLDVTHSRTLFGDGKAVADDIRARVKRETGLTLSAGVSWNKIYAKLGSDLKKPDATTLITPENRDAVVYPLPCSDLLTVGRATGATLLRHNIRTIGELAATDPHLLKLLFGVNGLRLSRYARGEDEEAVRLYYDRLVPKSVGHGVTSARDLETAEDLRVVVWFLCDMIGRRLRRAGLAASGVSVDLRDRNLAHRTFQRPLHAPTACGGTLAEAAFALASEHFLPGRDAALRTVTITSYDLSPLSAPIQASFFDRGDPQRDLRREQALDSIRDRFGANACVRALTLAQDFVYNKTDSEDFLPFRRESGFRDPV